MRNNRLILLGIIVLVVALFLMNGHEFDDAAFWTAYSTAMGQ